jgi:hypothetical protein
MTTLLIPPCETRATGRALAAWIAATALVLTACASGPPAPTAQLAASAATIDEAVSAGAGELAPIELNTARDKLERAHVAMNDSNNVRALILAEQAQVDAQLAMARTRSAKTAKAANSQQEDRRILREDIKRNER